jgi:ABC-type nitrate/sulfonate/bicarbonate transport system permease component
VTGGLLEQGLTRSTTAGQAPPRGPSRRRSRRVLGVLAPLALLGLWALVSARGIVSTRLLPSPLTVADAARDFFFGPRR